MSYTFIPRNIIMVQSITIPNATRSGPSDNIGSDVQRKLSLKYLKYNGLFKHYHYINTSNKNGKWRMIVQVQHFGKSIYIYELVLQKVMYLMVF